MPNKEQAIVDPILGVGSSKEQKADQSPFSYTAASRLRWDAHGFYDAETGEPGDATARQISLMKYGDMMTIKQQAAKVEETALDDPVYQEFVDQAMRTGRGDILVTSPGTWYVPKGARLLAEQVSLRLNADSAAHGVPPFVTDQPVPLSWQEFSQSTGSFARPFASLTPGKYAGHSVLFVSDLYTSDELAKWTQKALIEVGGAEAVHQLYAVKLEPDANDEVVEHLASTAVDGSLASIKGILSQPENPVVQRLLRVLLSPSHQSHLGTFFQGLPDEAVLKLFIAASQSDLRRNHIDAFQCAFPLLKSELEQRGWVGKDGRLFVQQKSKETKRSESEAPKRYVTHLLHSKKDISFEDARLYSRMKYSDPEATLHVAEQMTNTICESSDFQHDLESQRPIVIAPSAYGSVPTAAALIARHVHDLLHGRGIPAEMIKIHRAGQFSVTNFGAMTAEQRTHSMKQRKLFLSPEDEQKVSGAHIIVIDDLCATGAHERAIFDVLKATDACSTSFSYYIKFGERLMVNEPDTEEWLNRAEVKTIQDLTNIWMK